MFTYKSYVLYVSYVLKKVTTWLPILRIFIFTISYSFLIKQDLALCPGRERSILQRKHSTAWTTLSSALSNTPIYWPTVRINHSLSHADVFKEITHYNMNILSVASRPCVYFQLLGQLIRTRAVKLIMPKHRNSILSIWLNVKSNLKPYRFVW